MRRSRALLPRYGKIRSILMCTPRKVEVEHAFCDGIKYCTLRRNLGTIGCVIVAAYELTRVYRLAIKFRTAYEGGRQHLFLI